MNKIYAKSLGVIATVLSGVMLICLIEGNSAGGVTKLVELIGGGELVAQILTGVLALIGLGFGVRALFWNKVCIGEQCPIDVE